MRPPKPHLNPILHPSAQELQDEIKFLKARTDLYRKQAASLRRQKQVIENIRKGEESVEEAKRKMSQRRKKKWIVERQRLWTDVGFSQCHFADMDRQAGCGWMCTLK